MLLSKSSTYALRACLYLSRHPADENLSIRSIADNLNISFHFLTKIFQQLTRAGILRSVKGPRGGVSFSKSIHEIRLLDIVKAVEGTGLFSTCVLGLPDCGDDHPCPLHSDWSRERANLKAIFEAKTIAGFLDDENSKLHRLTSQPTT